jgi:hypothetical protein
MVRRMVFVLVLAALVASIAVPVEAGVRATLILTSGERITCVVVDMGGADITVMEGGNEVRLPLGDVAVIDFVGGGQSTPVAETSKIKTGQHLFVSRSGELDYGRLVDLGGNSPLRMTVKIAGGEIEINSNDIARVYFQRFQGMPAGR